MDGRGTGVLWCDAPEGIVSAGGSSDLLWGLGAPSQQGTVIDRIVPSWAGSL